MIKKKFILGGYFVVIPTLRAECMDNTLLPEKIISVSDCICDVVPGTWGLSWVKNRDTEIRRAKEIMKLTGDEFSKLEDWVTNKFDEDRFGWQYGFAELTDALEFCNMFLNKVDEIYLLSIGLSEEETKIFLEEEKPSGTGKPLVYGVLEKKIEIDLCNILGYDVLGYDCCSFHSYICNGLEKEFYKHLNIVPNGNCFYDTYEEAEKAANFLANEKVGAEPALWQPWVVCLAKKIQKR